MQRVIRGAPQLAGVWRMSCVEWDELDGRLVFELFSACPELASGEVVHGNPRRFDESGLILSATGRGSGPH